MGPTGTIQAGFNIPNAAAGARSYVHAAFNPLAADGTRLTCTALLSTCSLLSNPILNTSNSTSRALVPPGEPSIAYRSVANAEAGADRLLLLLIVRDEQGQGEVLARGCVEGIDVAEGQTTQVSVTLAPG
jgi:hypothetical protein